MLEGLQFIKKNSIFSFLITMTFFTSFFGMAYVFLMPVIAQDHLGLGPGAFGTLLSAGGVGSLLVTVWLGSRSTFRSKGSLIIGGAVLFGLSLIVFGLTSNFIGSFALALVVLFVMGVVTSTYMISIQSALQIMVPDAVRGRVMGFYGMTWSIMPLGAMPSGALATIIGAPFAIALGGLAVMAFAIGPALFNSKIRNLGSQIETPETGAGVSDAQPAPAQADS